MVVICFTTISKISAWKNPVYQCMTGLYRFGYLGLWPVNYVCAFRKASVWLLQTYKDYIFKRRIE